MLRDHTVKYHFCYCLLALKTFTSGFQPNNLGQKGCFLCCQRDFGITGLHRLIIFFIDKRLFRHGAGIVNPPAAETIGNVSSHKTVFKAGFQTPVIVVVCVWVIYQNPALLCYAGQNNKVLACSEDRVGVHQGNNNLPFF